MENKNCCGHNEHGVHVCVHVDGCGDSGGNTTNTIPVGHILTYMGTAAPENYLICDGTEYNIADYPELSEHLQKQFKSVNFFGGNGTDTFAVPDLRGEFLRGAGTAARDTGTGGAVGVHQEPTKVPHIGGDRNGIWWTPNAENDTEEHATEYDRLVYSKHGMVAGGQVVDKTGNWAVPEASNQPIGYNVRTTNTAVLYCIKYA